LENIGDKAARDVLRRLGTGAAGARLTREAQESLQRLSRRPSGESLGTEKGGERGRSLFGVSNREKAPDAFAT
jgi:hypothetical protein